MKKKALCLFVLMNVITIGVFSQFEKKMKDENVVVGSIIKDGKEIKGYVKIVWDVTGFKDDVYPAPWRFQSEVKFIPKDVFENTEKIKNKLYENYGPKDIEGYKYDTLVYESVKYSDMSAVGMGMLPKKMFMRKVINGKINVFHFFSTPPPIIEGNPAPHFIECGTPQPVYQKGKDGKLKLVDGMNVENELADCPYVIDKNAKGEYKYVSKDGKEATGLQKLANKTVFKVQVRLMIIEDYNKNCK